LKSSTLPVNGRQNGGDYLVIFFWIFVLASFYLITGLGTEANLSAKIQRYCEKKTKKLLFACFLSYLLYFS
jgi:hypothetical protein